MIFSGNDNQRTRRWTAVLALLALACGPVARAQTDTTRIVVVPFQGPAEATTWSFGLATALQRSLNVIPGVFVPPVGDPLVLIDRANAAGVDPTLTVLSSFGAAAVVGGRLAPAPGGWDVTLQLLDAAAVGTTRTVTVPDVPSVAVTAVALATIESLGLTPSAAVLDAVRAVAGDTPSFISWGAVAAASTRLSSPDPNALEAARQLDDTSAWVAAERARAAVFEGRMDEALALSAQSVDLVPHDVEAWTLRGVVASSAGDVDAARDAFQEALVRNPHHAVARLGWASTLPTEQAIPEYVRAIEAYPRLLEAHVALAEAEGGARALQRLRAAASALIDEPRLHAEIVDRALAANDAAGAAAYLASTVSNPLASSPATFGLAARLPLDRADRILEILREGAAAFPNDASLARTEASVLRRLGRFDEAAARLEPFAIADQADAATINEMARIWIALGRADEARSALASVSAESAVVRFNLARAYLEAGRPADAADELANDVAGGAADASTLALYGTALAGLGRFDEARAAYDSALAQDPTEPVAIRGLRRLDEWASIATDAPSPVRSPEAQAAFDAGLASLEAGRYGEAIAYLARASDAAPDDALIAFYYGSALQRDGRAREAIDAYALAIEAFPSSGTVLNNVGFAWLQLGRFDQALPALRQAIDVAPDNARAHLNLGLVYYALSRYDDALAAWDVAVNLDPTLEPAIRDTRTRATERSGARDP